MPIIGELVASRVPEHVGMDREWELSGFSGPNDCFKEARGRGRTAALSHKHIS